MSEATMGILNSVFQVLGWLGAGGIFAGIVVHYVGKKIDRGEKNRDEREKARVQEMVLLYEGQCTIGHLAEATAVALKEGKVNGKVDTALGHYRDYRERESAFLRNQAALQNHGGGD